MKASKIIEALQEVRTEFSANDLAYDDLSDETVEELEEEFGPFEYLETAERVLDDPESQRTVIHFKDHNIYIAMLGYYDSWSGGSFEDAEFYEVKRVEKTYIDWEEV